MVLGQVAAGILLGDFAVAVGHWFEDNYMEDDGVPQSIGHENVVHHAAPFLMTSSTYAKNVTLTTQIAIGVVLIIRLLVPAAFARYPWAILTTAFVGAMSNLMHRWIHERPCTRPIIVQVLQRAGVLVSSQEHAGHHRDPSVSYGVVLGFTNPVYDLVFRALESVFAAFGVSPRRKLPLADYQRMYGLPPVRGECPPTPTAADAALVNDRISRDAPRP